MRSQGRQASLESFLDFTCFSRSTKNLSLRDCVEAFVNNNVTFKSGGKSEVAKLFDSVLADCMIFLIISREPSLPSIP